MPSASSNDYPFKGRHDLQGRLETFLTDISLRLRRLEALKLDWDTALKDLVDNGIKRVDQGLVPVIESALNEIAQLDQLGNLFNATSATSLTVGVGQKALVLSEASRETYAATPYIALASAADPYAKVMIGALVGYDRESGVLTLDVFDTTGDGAVADDWLVMVTPPPNLDHALRTDNPHSVTAAQVGAYDTTQVDGSFAALLADPWALQVIGQPIPIFNHLAGVSVPPTDKGYRYIKLTAADGYNTGVLTSESVSGSAPNIMATAVVNDALSPLLGQTVRLINTEGRFVRPGATAGAIEEDQNAAHTHTGSADSNGSHSHTGSANSAGFHTHVVPDFGTADNTETTGTNNRWRDGASSKETSGNGAHTHSLSINNNGAHTHTLSISNDGGNEARPRNIRAVYYMRIR